MQTAEYSYKEKISKLLETTDKESGRYKYCKKAVLATFMSIFL